MSLKNAIRVGEILTEVKNNLPHGAYLPWLDKNMAFGRHQAANYMRVFAKRDLLNGEPVLHLKDAVRLLAVPNNATPSSFNSVAEEFVRQIEIRTKEQPETDDPLPTQEAFDNVRKLFSEAREALLKMERDGLWVHGGYSSFEDYKNALGKEYCEFLLAE